MNPRRRKNLGLTEEKRKEIVKRINSGVSQSEIAREIGCSRQYISVIYKESKLDPSERREKKRTGPRLYLSDEEKRKICKRIDKGESRVLIARELGCTAASVSYIYNQFGSGKRPKYRPPSAFDCLTAAQEWFIRDTILEKKPSDFKLGRKRKWTIDLAREMVKKEKQYLPTREQVYHIFLKYDVDTPDLDKLPPDTLKSPLQEYMETPMAKEIARREKLYQKRMNKIYAEKAEARRKKARPLYFDEELELLEKESSSKKKKDKEANQKGHSVRLGKHSKNKKDKKKKRDRKKKNKKKKR